MLETELMDYTSVINETLYTHSIRLTSINIFSEMNTYGFKEFYKLVKYHLFKINDLINIKKPTSSRLVGYF